MRGGLMAIAAGGAAIVLVAVVVAVLVVRSRWGEPTRATAPSADQGTGNATVGGEGMRARGTSELRQLGCETAVVVDMARLLGDAARVREGEPRMMVTCDVPATGDAPGCERVAAVYFAAIGGMAEDRVGVRVTRQGSRAPSCSRLYAPNGADLGSF
jgi:hypothetical protein